MTWRHIPFQSFDAFTNMAIDEAIMEAVREGRSPPTIRLYGWSPSAVSIGFFQGLRNEVDVGACQEAGVTVVRRITGGGAVYHDKEGEVTYSLIAPEGMFPKNIIESYRGICQPIIDALADFGIAAAFQPINDIIVGEGLNARKISGNAQTRRGGILLQHGTILWDVDVDRMFSLLKVSDEKMRDKLVHSVKKRVTCVKEYYTASQAELSRSLSKAFAAAFPGEERDYSAEEHARANTLARQKYGAADWNGQR
ncbi:MAG: biotin/lipoate A/B protein ligase family protein [Nanoarchaeota archaeon]